MAELIGLDELNNIINTFVKSINSELTAKVGFDFCCIYDENIIYYPLLIEQVAADKFLKDIQKRYNYSGDYYIIALLHEIFHIETWDDNSELDFLISTLGKWLIKYHLLPKFLYFHLPLERRATEGAIKWAKSHTDEINILSCILSEKFNTFYINNDIH